MVVPTHVQIWLIEPNIEVDVVVLHSLAGVVLLESRASYDQELIVEASD